MKTARYDVVVAGGGPAGLCAAVEAARAGAKCALLERFGGLGGMLTSGAVQPILGSVEPGTMYDELTGLFLQNHPEIAVPRTRNGREVPVDVEEVKSILPGFAADAGVDVYLLCPVVEAQTEGGRILSVVAAPPEGMTRFVAPVFIDATGDGSLAVLAGAGYAVGREADGKCQPGSIEFLLSGVDESVALSCFGGSDPVTLPDGRRYAEVCKAACASGELPENVSIVRLHRTARPGERNVNATQANGFDYLDARAVARAELLLRGQIGQIVKFLQKNVPGYAHCVVKSSGSTVGVRETRRIFGLQTITDRDVETGAHCADAVVRDAWFLIDIHNPAGGGQAEKHSQPAIPYDIPYGALVCRDVRGLLLAGRCISGTHRAHASYRVMAICMATGQAAGAAAALCAKAEKTPDELDFRAVRRALINSGCMLTDKET